MKTDKIKAFLFDLDGVIIDTESKYSEIWHEIDRLFPTGVENFPKRIKGSTLEAILGNYYPEPELRQQVTDKLYELEGKIIYEYCAGAREFLDYLKGKKIPTVLVTSSNNIKMAKLWDQLPDLKEKLDHVITGDMVEKSKPDPEGYLNGIGMLGLSPEECAVVEDSQQGVVAGRNAGAFVIGVSGTMSPDELNPWCDIITGNLMNLTKIISI